MATDDRRIERLVLQVTAAEKEQFREFRDAAGYPNDAECMRDLLFGAIARRAGDDAVNSAASN